MQMLSVSWESREGSWESRERGKEGSSLREFSSVNESVGERGLKGLHRFELGTSPVDCESCRGSARRVEGGELGRLTKTS